MDLDEWEILPDEGFLDYHEDAEKKIIVTSRRSSNTKTVFNMDYFMCPSSPPKKSRAVPNQLVPVPIQLETADTTGKEQEEKLLQEVTKVPIDISEVPPAIMPKVKDAILGSKEADQDSVSQVFFKKMNENEFVDMKMDSPKSGTKAFLPPQIDAAAGTFKFDGKSEVLDNKVSSPRFKNEKEVAKEEDKAIWEENTGGLNLWKWSFTGFGAICSFGVAAAATICIMILGGHQKSKQQHQNPNFRFQIYTDDKVCYISDFPIFLYSFSFHTQTHIFAYFCTLSIDHVPFQQKHILIHMLHI
uniref:DUF6821 domain-containing protein n=1 Tax=Rhizophora mucronata TaxID=61149 RepID=A0A2P2MTE1_RHIMU